MDNVKKITLGDKKNTNTYVASTDTVEKSRVKINSLTADMIGKNKGIVKYNAVAGPTSKNQQISKPSYGHSKDIEVIDLTLNSNLKKIKDNQKKIQDDGNNSQSSGSTIASISSTPSYFSPTVPQSSTQSTNSTLSGIGNDPRYTNPNYTNSYNNRNQGNSNSQSSVSSISTNSSSDSRNQTSESWVAKTQNKINEIKNIAQQKKNQGYPTSTSGAGNNGYVPKSIESISDANGSILHANPIEGKEAVQDAGRVAWLKQYQEEKRTGKIPSSKSDAIKGLEKAIQDEGKRITGDL